MEFMKKGLVDKRMNEEEGNQNERTENNRHRMQIFKDGKGLACRRIHCGSIKNETRIINFILSHT